LRMIRDGMLLPDNVWTSPTPAGQGGDALHGVAIHPQFAQNNLVYMSYPKQGPQGTTLAISRGRPQGRHSRRRSRDLCLPTHGKPGATLRGRILLGPDASLYVTVGDRDRICCNGTDDNSPPS
jgi:glucose/arabinose dehydrogenase